MFGLAPKWICPLDYCVVGEDVRNHLAEQLTYQDNCKSPHFEGKTVWLRGDSPTKILYYNSGDVPYRSMNAILMATNRGESWFKMQNKLWDEVIDGRAGATHLTEDPMIHVAASIVSLGDKMGLIMISELDKTPKTRSADARKLLQIFCTRYNAVVGWPFAKTRDNKPVGMPAALWQD